MAYTRSASPVLTELDPAGVWAELDLVRTDCLWGQIATADIGDAIVQTEHIVAPRVRGWPVQGADGEFGAVASDARVNDGVKLSPSATLAADRVTKWDRFDIFHLHLRTEDGTTAIPGLTKMIRARRAGRVIVEAQWSAVSADDDAGATPPAPGDAWGYFVVMRQRRASGSGTAVTLEQIPHSVRYMRARYDTVAQHFHVIAAIEVSGSSLGDQTFSVVYVRDGVVAHTSGNPMVSIGYRSINVEFEAGG